MEINNNHSFYKNSLNKINLQTKNLGTKDLEEKFSLAAMESADSKKKLQKVANEMESLIVKMMFKSMKISSPRDTLIHGGQAENFFDDMLLDEYSKISANNQSLGIAKMIYEQNAKYVKDISKENL